MTQVLETKRLLLRHIELDDAAFIHELMNEPPWIEFIGDLVAGNQPTLFVHDMITGATPAISTVALIESGNSANSVAISCRLLK